MPRGKSPKSKSNNTPVNTGRHLDLREDDAPTVDRPAINDTPSEIEITAAAQSILDNKPDTDAPYTVVGKFLDQCYGYVRRGTHECFLLAWHAGEILSAIKNRCPHGNTAEVKSGKARTFEDVVKTEFDKQDKKSICLRTAERWVDLYNYVKPDDADWSRMTIEAAYQTLDARKSFIEGEKIRADKRAGKVKGKKKKTEVKEPPVLGNAIASIRNAGKKLPEAAQHYHDHPPRVSAASEVDKLDSHLGDIWKAVENLFTAAKLIAEMRQTLLGNKNKGSVKVCEAMERVAAEIERQHTDYLKIAPNGEAAPTGEAA